MSLELQNLCFFFILDWVGGGLQPDNPPPLGSLKKYTNIVSVFSHMRFLRPPPTLKMEAAFYSETLGLSIILHYVISQKTAVHFCCCFATSTAVETMTVLSVIFLLLAAMEHHQRQ